MKWYQSRNGTPIVSSAFRRATCLRPHLLYDPHCDSLSHDTFPGGPSGMATTLPDGRPAFFKYYNRGKMSLYELD